VAAKTEQLEPRRISWQSWAALIYVLVLYPVAWGNGSRTLHPGLHAVLANGSRWGWYAFFGTVFVLEWAGFFLCLWALRSEGRKAKEIGLYSRHFTVYLILFGVAIAAFSAVVVAMELGRLPTHPADPHSLFGFTSAAERFFWLALSLTGGVCEETIFRGFAITYLRRLVRSTWLAVLISTLAFAYMHGGLMEGLFLFGMRFALGVLFAVIYLWRKSLLPSMFLHFLTDAVFAL
jgi:CAAX protease family protein